MNDVTKPLVYLILGAAGTGRREVLADFIIEGLTTEDRALVLLSDKEEASEWDAKLGKVERWSWREQGGGADGQSGVIAEPEAGALAGATHVFFVTDGRRNPVDQVEAFKPWLEAQGGELARVICVVNCALAEKHRELMAWYEACIYFSDAALLARREGVANKWMSDFQARFAGLFYPCVFEFVKHGRVKNPALILEPQARRMSHYFDEADYELADGDDIESGVDDEEEDTREDNKEIEVIEVVDEYMALRAGGRRVKEIPDIAKFLA